MSGWTLRVQAGAGAAGRPARRDAGCAGRPVERRGRALPVGHGNALVPLAEFFSVEAARATTRWCSRRPRRASTASAGRWTAGRIVGRGQCRRLCRRLHDAAASSSCDGDAGALAACEMAGGTLDHRRQCRRLRRQHLARQHGRHARRHPHRAGNAGARFGDRMRRGTALVFGDAGDFLASRMVAGTIAHRRPRRRARRLRHAPRQRGVRRRGAADVAPTFVPAIADAAVFWQLLARDLARHGGPFATPGRRAASSASSATWRPAARAS